MKNFNGKAIYNPSGKAGEYSYWACNFFTGCSNDCQYCFCKRGVMSSTWSTTPMLKKCFRSESHALDVFEREMLQNKAELQKHGLFFSFTTDPFLKETCYLTANAMILAFAAEIPVKVLTKRADFVDTLIPFLERECSFELNWKDMFAFGFTLTGHDELEANASTNAERIESMRKLHDAGFKTWASIEPIIYIDSSYKMILDTLVFCDLYKIGLQSGRKYNQDELHGFLSHVLTMACYAAERKVYFKDSLLEQAKVTRESLPANCVGRDYNIFRN